MLVDVEASSCIVNQSARPSRQQLGGPSATLLVSRRTIARILDKIEGVTEVHLGGRFGSPDDVRIEFKCQGHDFIVMEPFGDNSRYRGGPKGGKNHVAAGADIGRIKAAFEGYKPPLPVEIFGDLVALNFKGLFRHG
jgi:hypothetical protein